MDPQLGYDRKSDGALALIRSCLRLHWCAVSAPAKYVENAHGENGPREIYADIYLLCKALAIATRQNLRKRTGGDIAHQEGLAAVKVPAKASSA